MVHTSSRIDKAIRRISVVLSKRDFKDRSLTAIAGQMLEHFNRRDDLGVIPQQQVRTVLEALGYMELHQRVTIAKNGQGAITVSAGTRPIDTTK